MASSSAKSNLPIQQCVTEFMDSGEGSNSILECASLFSPFSSVRQSSWTVERDPIASSSAQVCSAHSAVCDRVHGQWRGIQWRPRVHKYVQNRAPCIIAVWVHRVRQQPFPTITSIAPCHLPRATSSISTNPHQRMQHVCSAGRENKC
jgi:hypothetical protein